MEEGKKKRIGFTFVNILIFLGTVLLTGTVTWFFRESATETIRNTVVNITGCGILIYVIETAKNDIEMPGRIAWSYFAGLFACLGGAFLPAYTIPLAAFGLILMLLSDFSVGICAYTLFCINITLLSASSADVFFYYFITGLFAMALYVRILKSSFRIVLPLIMIVCISTVLYTALSVLKFYQITVSMIMNPLIGLFLNIFILSIALYVYKKNILFAYHEKYLEINDPEYTLLTQLKAENKSAYYTAIHTAYLCDRIADRLGLDRRLLKAGGYYEKIGILLDEDYDEKNRELMIQNRFPPRVIRLVEECSPNVRYPVQKEAAIVRMSDAVITRISRLIREKPDEKIHYGTVIDDVTDGMLNDGTLSACNLTVGEYYRIQRYFKEEALYYDFLR